MTPELDEQLIETNNDLVYGLTASPSLPKPGAACFAARGTGLYRSDDGGKTWNNLFHTLFAGQTSVATAVATSPDFEHDRTVFAGMRGGVLRSTDGGLTWRASIYPPPEPTVVALAVSPNFAEDDMAFAGTAEDGVFFSSDGGVNWTAWNFGLLDMNILCLAISPSFSKDEILFAGTTTGLFVSNNGGRAWREVALPVDMPAIISLAISPNYASDRIIYVGTEENGLLRSSWGVARAGLRWEALGSGSLTYPINGILLDLAFPESTEVLVLHGSQLLFSRDRGNTFQKWARPELQDPFDATAAAAPRGFGPDAPVLVGGGGGVVLVV